MIVHIGVYNLTAKDEEGVIHANVDEIYVYPDWDQFDTKYDADVAILVLSHHITFTNNIRPACMPADTVDIDSATIDVNGTIVGWGFSENNIFQTIPRQASIIAINDSYCYTTDPMMPTFSSNRTFCGGFGNGIPNSGDSGSGFFVESDGIWVQYGIISAIRTNKAGHVIPDSLAVYTNVRSFKSWIVDTVKKTGGAVTEAIIKRKLVCFYGYNLVFRYMCKLTDLDIRKENIEVESITGSHENDKTNEDVRLLQFTSGSLVYLPKGIGKFFKNVQSLQVNDNLGTKLITRSNFENMTQLVELYFFDNQIELLNEDSFWDLPNLEIFQLQNNKIKEINDTLFDRNEKLWSVNIKSNKMLEILPKNLFKNNPYLREVILDDNRLKEIPEKMFEKNIKLKYASMKSNRLGDIPRNLFKNNFLLEAVSFDNNLLKAIDEYVFQFSANLKDVDLSSNQLESLSRNLFRNTTLLKKVSFVNCSLKTIDEEIFAFNEKLKKVLLSSNRLDSLPDKLFTNKLSLEVVELKNNNLKILDEQMFETNVKLKIVWFSANRIESLPGNLFQNNLNLQYVNLSLNLLRTIDENIFKENSMLNVIDLSSNQLEYLPMNLLKNNLLLQIVNFDDNFLRKIEFDLSKLSTKRNIFTRISFYRNSCIDGMYFKINRRMDRMNSNVYRNLTEFQNLLNINCSSLANTPIL